MSTPLLRPARSDDAANLAALGMLVWLHTYSSTGLRRSLADYVLARFTRAAKTALLADSQRHIVVAEQNGHLLGYATLHWQHPCPAQPASNNELETLYVHPLFAGQGIGYRLLQYCQQQCAPRGGLWLSVWQYNHRALAFYQRQGLLKIGEYDFMLDGEAHRNWLLA